MDYQHAISEKIYEDRCNEAISMMLKENTGKELMDSGGAYGRAWQRCANDDFEVKPESTIELSNGGSVMLLKSTYHFFKAFFDITERSKQLEKDFWNMIDGNADETYGEITDEWVRKILTDGFVFVDEDGEEDKERFRYRSSGYTYNGENALDREYVYTFLRDRNDYETYIIVQTHNGCDARGGFSSPHIFALDDCESVSDMYMCMTDYALTVYNPTTDVYTQYYSNNCGYKWSRNNDSAEIFDEDDMGELLIKAIFGDVKNFDVNNVKIEGDVVDTWENKNGDGKSIWIGGSLDHCNIIVLDE